MYLATKNGYQFRIQQHQVSDMKSLGYNVYSVDYEIVADPENLSKDKYLATKDDRTFFCDKEDVASLLGLGWTISEETRTEVGDLATLGLEGAASSDGIKQGYAWRVGE